MLVIFFFVTFIDIYVPYYTYIYKLILLVGFVSSFRLTDFSAVVFVLLYVLMLYVYILSLIFVRCALLCFHFGPKDVSDSVFDVYF